MIHGRKGTQTIRYVVTFEKLGSDGDVETRGFEHASDAEALWQALKTEPLTIAICYEIVTVKVFDTYKREGF